MSRAPCTIITDGPAHVVAQNVQATMRLPVPFVKEHLPEVEKLPVGDKHVIRVQLVYLRPFACDVTQETPAVRVEQLNDGVTVRKDRGRGELFLYSLAGAPLCASQATINGYYVRGYRYLGQMHIQMLCSPQLSPDLQAAKDAMREQHKQTRELNKQLQSQESVVSQEHQQPKMPGKLHRLPNMPSGESGIVWEAEDAVIARTQSLPAGTAAGRISSAGTAAASSAPTAAAPAQSSKKEPYHGGMAMSMQNGTVIIPAQFVKAHMPELEAVPVGTSKAIQVQLVLLPPYASDIAPGAPTTAVKNFGLLDGVTVRKGPSQRPPGVRYPVSGIALTTAKPCKEGWYQRGVRLLGPMHIQILCSPKLSPAVEKAKAELLARRRKEQQQQEQQQERARQPGNKPQHEDSQPPQQLKQQHSQPAPRQVSRLVGPLKRASSDGAAAPALKRLRTSSSVASKVAGAFAAALAAAATGVITCEDSTIPDGSDSDPEDDVMAKHCSNGTAAGAEACAAAAAAAAEDNYEPSYSCGGPLQAAPFSCDGSRESTPFSCGAPPQSTPLSCVESPQMTLALPPSPTWPQEQQPDTPKQATAVEQHTLQQPKQPVRCQQQQPEACLLEQQQLQSSEKLQLALDKQQQESLQEQQQQQQQSPDKRQQSPDEQQQQLSDKQQQESPQTQHQQQSPEKQQQSPDRQQQSPEKQQQLSTDHAAALREEIESVQERWRRSKLCLHWDGTRGSCTYGDRCPFVDSHILGKATSPIREIRTINDKYRQLRRGQVNSSRPDSGRMQQQEKQLPPVQGLSFVERQRQREMNAGIDSTYNSLHQEQQQKQSKQGLSYAERQLIGHYSPAASKQLPQQQTGREAASPLPHRYDDGSSYLNRTEKGELVQLLTSVDSRWSSLPFRLCKYWNGVEGSCAKRHRCICASTHKLGQPTMHYLERRAAFERFGVVPDENGCYFLYNRVVRKQQQQQQQQQEEYKLVIATSGTTAAAADKGPVVEASMLAAAPESEQQQQAEVGVDSQEYVGIHTAAAAVQGYSGYSLGDDSDRLSVDSMGWQSVESDSDAEQDQLQEYLNERQQQRWQHWQQTEPSLPQQHQQQQQLEVDVLGEGSHQQKAPQQPQHDMALPSGLLQQPVHAQPNGQCLGEQTKDHQQPHQQQQEQEEEEAAEHAADMEAIDGWQSPEASDVMDDDQPAVEEQAGQQSVSAVQPSSVEVLPPGPLQQQQQQPQQQDVLPQQAFNVQLPPLRMRQLQRLNLSPQRQADSAGTPVRGTSPTASEPFVHSQLQPQCVVSAQVSNVVPATSAAALHAGEACSLLESAPTSVVTASNTAAAAGAITNPAAAAVAALQNPLLQPQQSSTFAAAVEQAQQASSALPAAGAADSATTNGLHSSNPMLAPSISLATSASAAQAPTCAIEQHQQLPLQPQPGTVVVPLTDGQLLLQASHSVSSHRLLPIKEEALVPVLTAPAIHQHTESAVGPAADELPLPNKQQAHMQSAACPAATSSSSGQRGLASRTFNNSNNSSAQLPLLPDNPGVQLTDALRTELLCLVSVLDKCFPGELDVCDCGETLADIQEDPVAEVRFMKRAYPAVCSAVATDNKEQAMKAVKRYLLPK